MEIPSVNYRSDGVGFLILPHLPGSSSAGENSHDLIFRRAAVSLQKLHFRIFDKHLRLSLPFHSLLLSNSLPQVNLAFLA